MPPAKKAVTETVTPLLERGVLVNIEKGGRTLTNYKVLDYDDRVVKFQGSVLNSPQTELVLIPWEKIEAIGLV